MTIKNVDVTLHIDENLARSDSEELQCQLLSQPGVTAADCHNGYSHLYLIRYNPDVVSSAKFLEIARSKDLHAELIGL